MKSLSYKRIYKSQEYLATLGTLNTDHCLVVTA